jgi:hypothetical protein
VYRVARSWGAVSFMGVVGSAEWGVVICGGNRRRKAHDPLAPIGWDWRGCRSKILGANIGMLVRRGRILGPHWLAEAQGLIGKPKDHHPSGGGRGVHRAHTYDRDRGRGPIPCSGASAHPRRMAVHLGHPHPWLRPSHQISACSTRALSVG